MKRGVKMSNEYIISISSKDVYSAITLGEMVRNSSDYVVSDVDFDGFSCYIKEHYGNPNIEKWGGDFYIKRTKGNAFLLVINSCNIDSEVRNLLSNIFKKENVAYSVEDA
jgi:hypothetical protein